MAVDNTWACGATNANLDFLTRSLSDSRRCPKRHLSPTLSSALTLQSAPSAVSAVPSRMEDLATGRHEYWAQSFHCSPHTQVASHMPLFPLNTLRSRISKHNSSTHLASVLYYVSSFHSHVKDICAFVFLYTPALPLTDLSNATGVVVFVFASSLKLPL